MAVLALLAGCTVDVELGQECPELGEMCSPPAAAAAGVTSAASAPPPPAALQVQLEIGESARSQVAVNCEQPCFEVRAVAWGGVPPYTFAWDDGPADATRLLCPEATTHYSVSVRDASASATAQQSEAPAPAARTQLDALVTACAQPESPSPTDSPATDTVAMKSCDRLPLQWPPRQLNTKVCAPSLWRLLPRPVRAGKMHVIRARGQGLWAGRWKVELWGTPNGCDLVEQLGEFNVEQAPVDARLRFIPAFDHNMLVLNVVEEVDSGFHSPYIGYRLCTTEQQSLP